MQYAEVLEIKRQYSQSSALLEHAYNYLVERSSSLSKRDEWRRIKLAVKIGDLSEKIQEFQNERKWKTRAIADLTQSFPCVNMVSRLKDPDSDQRILLDVVSREKDSVAPLVSMAWFQVKQGEIL